jgi:outer membrane protein assembly factor BamB
VYVLDGDGSVRVFNASGMEVYRFNEEGELGNIIDVAVDKDGTILALMQNPGQKTSIIRCNYRGDLVATLELKDIPSGFAPATMAHNNGHIYLVNKSTMQVVITDEQGRFERSIDLFDEVGGNRKKKQDYEMGGFSVDREGNILFTLPIQFKAYKYTPDGKLESFGQAGSSPGKFNVAAGIVSDGNGHYFVSDKLKSSILVFDQDFKFMTQVGERGYGPGGLIVPMDLAIMDNQLYVTQSAAQGISVFGIKQ